MPFAAPLIAVLLLGGGGSMSIADRAGDSHGAPDITGLTISVSDSGQATFRVAAKLLAGSKDGVVSVYIDADNNASTGSPADGGADFVFAHYQSDLTWNLYRWDTNASAWAPVADMSTVSAKHDTSGVTFSASRKVLGDASHIRVFAKTAGAVSQVGSGDRAPNTGWASFDLAPFTLKAAGFHAAETGGQLTLTMAATRSDDGNYANTVTCALTAAGSPLHARAAVLTANGVPTGTCVWTIAKTLKGKTLRASITESSEGRSVTKTATLKAT